MTSTATVELTLTEAELRMVIEALETRIEHLMNYGSQRGFWNTPEERELVLGPLQRLSRSLLVA